MKNLSVLVVDDDPVIRRLLEQRLSKEEYVVGVAEDGYRAQEMLQEQNYDVVLTDLMMPGDIGGIEVLDIAKEISSNTEVLLITAHSSVSSAVAAMKKGAADYLEKPINFDELFLRLDKIANFQSLLKNARDLQLAMSTTEGEASFTIQSLELEVSRLQHILDETSRILEDEATDDSTKVSKAIQRLGQMEHPY